MPLYCVVALSQASCAYSPAQADVASTPAVHAVHGRSDRAQAGSQRLGLCRVRRDADAHWLALIQVPRALAWVLFLRVPVRMCECVAVFVHHA